jgi:hypothetical protein
VAALSALADPRRDEYAGSVLTAVQWYGLLVAVLRLVPATAVAPIVPVLIQKNACEAASSRIV